MAKLRNHRFFSQLIKNKTKALFLTLVAITAYLYSPRYKNGKYANSKYVPSGTGCTRMKAIPGF